jgi:glutathione S-transferase
MPILTSATPSQGAAVSVSADRPYVFHAFEVSYFSAKVRPALRYKRLWYDEVHADYQLIRERTGLTFIPMLLTPDGEAWQDSTEIYDRLEARHPDPPLFPSTPVQRIAAHLVELYTDEFGLIPAMHYRWGSELGEASARARFIAMVGSEELGTAAAARMAKARIILGARDENAPAIEARADGTAGRTLLHGLRVAQAAARDRAPRGGLDRALQSPERTGPGRVVG